MFRLSLEYHDFKILEFIVTDKDEARHHFPKEHYDYSIYQEQLIHIDSFDFNEVRREYNETIRRLIEGGNSNGQEQHIERPSEK